MTRATTKPAEPVEDDDPADTPAADAPDPDEDDGDVRPDPDDEDQADDDQPAAAARPAHANQLCPLCGVHELHPTTTGYACEHGTWDLTES